MPQVDINYVAVLAAAVVNMALGFFWYGPLFGKQWMKLAKISREDLERMKKKGMGKTYAMSTLGSLVMAYVLAHFVGFGGATDVVTGALTGLWVAVGFVAVVKLNDVLYEDKPQELYLLNVGYHAVALVLMGALLAVWL